MPLVLTQIENFIGTITMNHLEKRNVLDRALIEALIEAFEEFRLQEVRTVILRAPQRVKVWSAGYDVKQLPCNGRDPLGWSNLLRMLIRKVEEFPVPIIAMIEGSVWGGACELALACDLLVATPNASFAITPAKLGVPYNLSGILNFMNSVSLHIVRELLFTAQPMKAERAERLGIINHLVPNEDLESFTYNFAEQIILNSPLCISVMKEELRILSGANALTTEIFEHIQGLRQTVCESEDYQEGVTAFLEKRKPVFKGK